MNEHNSVNGTLILVLGIVGLIFSLVVGLVGLICGLIAWSMGDSAIKKLDAAGIHEGSERSNASIGRTCGVIAALLFLGRLLFVLLLTKRYLPGESEVGRQKPIIPSILHRSLLWLGAGHSFRAFVAL